MALYSDLPVYKSTYDLLLAIFRFTKDYGKEYKYSVGESLKKETIEKNQRNANSKQVASQVLTSADRFICKKNILSSEKRSCEKWADRLLANRYSQ
jgi:hypothetical protein